LIQCESLEIFASEEISLTDELRGEMVDQSGFLFVCEYPVMQFMDCAIVQISYLVQRPLVVPVADGRRWNAKLPSPLWSRKVRAYQIEPVKDHITSRSPSIAIWMRASELLPPATIRPQWQPALSEVGRRHSRAETSQRYKEESAIMIVA
jgi:hypothetical protein